MIADDARIVGHVREPVDRRRQEGDPILEAVDVDERPAERGRRLRFARAIPELRAQLDRRAVVRRGDLDALHGGGGLGGQFVEDRLVRGLGRDAQRLLAEVECLLVRAQGCRPIRGRAQRDPGLAGQGVPLGTGGAVRVGGQVLAGEGTGELVGTQRLEVTRGREVARLAIGAGHHVVGDLADQRLHEPVLAALRRARVDVRAQELPLGERPQPDARGPLPAMPETARQAGDA